MPEYPVGIPCLFFNEKVSRKEGVILVKNAKVELNLIGLKQNKTKQNKTKQNKTKQNEIQALHAIHSLDHPLLFLQKYHRYW